MVYIRSHLSYHTIVLSVVQTCAVGHCRLVCAGLFRQESDSRVPGRGRPRHVVRRDWTRAGSSSRKAWEWAVSACRTLCTVVARSDKSRGRGWFWQVGKAWPDKASRKTRHGTSSRPCCSGVARLGWSRAACCAAGIADSLVGWYADVLGWRAVSCRGSRPVMSRDGMSLVASSRCDVSACRL